MATAPTLESILHEIAQIQRMERGTLSVFRRGPKRAYHNHQCYEHGRNVSRYVCEDQVPALKEALEGYARFGQLVEQYAELVVNQTRAERLAGSKKNSLHLSSSRRTRKSSN
jgi:hypothetical protein